MRHRPVSDHTVSFSACRLPAHCEWLGRPGRLGAPRYDNARCPIVCTSLRSSLRVCQSVYNRHLMRLNQSLTPRSHSSALKRLREARGLQPSHDNRPRRLQPHCNASPRRLNQSACGGLRPRRAERGGRRAVGGRPDGLADGRTAGRWLPVARGGRQGGRAPSVEKAV